MNGTTTNPAQFLLRDNITGRFTSPDPITWDEAKAAVEANPFLTIVRKDEVA